MGHPDFQPAAIAASKLAGKALELLRVGDNGADYHDGVPQYGHILNMPDADMKLMIEEAAKSPPSDAENI